MDRSILARLSVYLVTDRTQTGGRPLPGVIEQALLGGVRAVQLRERGIESQELLVLARELRALTRRYDALLLVNDRIDIALACEADGVHLPSHSFRIPDARALMGASRLIGVSTHHVDEVRAAADAGADFVVFGPVYATPSKQAYGAPLGLTALQTAARVAIPVLGIGGITSARVADVRAHGAAGVAVVRALLGADDPSEAAVELLNE